MKYYLKERMERIKEWFMKQEWKINKLDTDRTPVLNMPKTEGTSVKTTVYMENDGGIIIETIKYKDSKSNEIEYQTTIRTDFDELYKLAELAKVTALYNISKELE